ncbi:MAG: hypothetical protein PF638_01980 [Candidatus Delongbacteria bacterium]|jgi:hypothetical protein|nr:hypothetical protein [Candidatus Delongbacteria bacterium]
MNKRIFISFAIEDVILRDFLVGQARNNNSPFEFVDMSVNEPWDSSWKTNCRRKIKGCDGMIIITTQNTPKADGQLWEIKCALEENVPALAIWGRKTGRRISLPSEFTNFFVHDWSWPNIADFIESL